MNEKSKPYKAGCKILYFDKLQEDPLYVKKLLVDAGLKPIREKFDDKFYYLCKTDNGNMTVEANKGYIAIFWQWAPLDKIQDSLKSLYGFNEELNDEMEEIIIKKRDKLFWRS